MRVPNLVARLDLVAATLASVAARWQASRSTSPRARGDPPCEPWRESSPCSGIATVDSIEPADVAAFVCRAPATDSSASRYGRPRTLAMVLDFAGRRGAEPARDRLTVKLPHEARGEPKPPTAETVLAVTVSCPRAYRLPLLVLDATGMRVGELEALTWGDVDEVRCGGASPRPSRRLVRHAGWPSPSRCSEPSSACTTRRPHPSGVCSRASLPTVCGRRSRARARRGRAGVLAARSPAPRISLLHLRGVPWARIGEHVGQRNLAVTANTYTHVLVDENEIDYAALVEGAGRQNHGSQGTDKLRRGARADRELEEELESLDALLLSCASAPASDSGGPATTSRRRAGTRRRRLARRHRTASENGDRAPGRRATSDRPLRLRSSSQTAARDDLLRLRRISRARHGEPLPASSPSSRTTRRSSPSSAAAINALARNPRQPVAGAENRARAGSRHIVDGRQPLLRSRPLPGPPSG